jgi:hypothetical protein
MVYEDAWWEMYRVAWQARRVIKFWKARKLNILAYCDREFIVTTDENVFEREGLEAGMLLTCRRGVLILWKCETACDSSSRTFIKHLKYNVMVSHLNCYRIVHVY